MDWLKLRKKGAQWVGKYKFIVLIVLIGIMLMLIPGGKEDQPETEPVTNGVAEEIALAQELSQILMQVKGAGKVEVMLTRAAGEKTVYQTDENRTDGSEKTDTVIVTDQNRTQNGLVQRVEAAEYRGAIVVCQGADSPSVRLAIIDAVAKVTGLDSSRISVLKMK